MGKHPSDRKVSAAASAGEWASLRMEAVRKYEDEALLDRVRMRLERGERQTAHRTRLGLQAAAALVVFGVGVGVGRGLPELTQVREARSPSPQVAAETRTGAATIRRERTPEKREPRPGPSTPRTERKRSSPPSMPMQVVSAEEDAAVAASESVVEVPPSLTTASPRSAWLDLADQGDYPGALAELERSQVAHLVLATGSVEELMTMAEVARFAGNQERAIQALSQVVDRYGRDPNAPLAAMMLGNLLSRAGDAKGAARAYARNRLLSPGGDFAEDALVREFDLALAAENPALASSLFDQYAREFPAGPHLYAMRYELDELLASAHAKTNQAGATRPEALPNDEDQHTSDRTDEHAAEPSAPDAD